MERSVGILFENNEGKILFLLRDNKSSIPFPNRWCGLGGVVEEGESSKEAIIGEMQEEIELNLKDFNLFKVFHWPEKIETIFHKKLDIDVNSINLHEGQRIQYFSKDELLNMDLAFHDNEIIREFFNR